MPNLNENVNYRVSSDTSDFQSKMEALPQQAKRAGDKVSAEMSRAGAKAGDAFGKNFDSKINKSMQLLGSTLRRYFGEFGGILGDAFQTAKEVREILNNPSGKRGSGAGVAVADIASDIGQTAATSRTVNNGNQKIAKLIDNGIIDANNINPNTGRPFFKAPVNGAVNAAGAVAGAGGMAAGAVGTGLAATLGIAAGIGAAVAGIGMLIVKAVDARVEISSLAKQLNVSTDTAKEFISIGNSSGNLDGFKNSLVSLVDLLEKARNGSDEAAKALARLGVTNAFEGNKNVLTGVLDNLIKIEDQAKRDIAATRAGVPLANVDAYAAKKNNSDLFGKLSSLDTMTPEGDIEVSGPTKTVEERRLEAKKQIVELDKMSGVDPKETREAESTTKAIEERVKAEEELSDVRKKDYEVINSNIEQAQKKIKLVEIELENAQGIAEAEQKRAEIAQLNLNLGKLRVQQEEKLYEIANKRATIQNDLIDSRLKTASDGKLSLSELAKTNTRAGREASGIASLEENYNNAVASGNTGLAKRIRDRINSKKLGLVNSGILAPTELQFEQYDQYGNKTASGFNQMDVLAGLNGNQPTSAAEILKAQQARGSELAAGNRTAGMAEYIRGMRGNEARDQVRSQAASLLELIQTNGGALPVRAIIQ